MAKKKKRAESEVEGDGIRKTDSRDDLANGAENGKKEEVEEEKKKRRKRKRKIERDGVESKKIPTVSIAVPGSIIDNAQSLELATRVLSLSLSLACL